MYIPFINHWNIIYKQLILYVQHCSQNSSILWRRYAFVLYCLDCSYASFKHWPVYYMIANSCFHFFVFVKFASLTHVSVLAQGIQHLHVEFSSADLNSIISHGTLRANAIVRKIVGLQLAVRCHPGRNISADLPRLSDPAKRDGCSVPFCYVLLSCIAVPSCVMREGQCEA